MAKVTESFSVDEEVQNWLKDSDMNKSQLVNQFLAQEMQKQKLGKKTVLEQQKAEIKSEIQQKKSEIQRLEEDLDEVERELEEVADQKDEIVEDVLTLAEKLITTPHKHRERKYEPVGPLRRNTVKDILEDVNIHYVRTGGDDIHGYDGADEFTDWLQDQDWTDDWGGPDGSDEAFDALTNLTPREEAEIRNQVGEQLD